MNLPRERTLILLCLVIAIAYRVPSIHRSLGHDEIYLLVMFAFASYGQILSDYSLHQHHLC
ncbi:MAG: hypothetical protein VX733_09675 [Candidatus Latescibacterota bacterium]|nr:hypothetical protein [Candidatus Latescibacterota bacterium]